MSNTTFKLDLDGLITNPTTPEEYDINTFICSCISQHFMSDFIDGCYASITADYSYISDLEGYFSLDTPSGDDIYALYEAIRSSYRHVFAHINTKITDLLAVKTKTSGSVSTVLRDSIKQLITEFGATVHSNRITIPIKNVVLETDYLEHDFGDYEMVIVPYDVMLHYMEFSNRADHAEVYKIYTENPEKARLGDSQITHPHINNNELCEGDGYSAVGNALKRSDLLSLYMIVEGIVHSYYAPGAYRTLARWSAAYCDICDCTIDDDDDMGTCDACGSTMCSECARVCGCDNYVCDNCMTSCGVCSHVFCTGCNDELIECSKCLYLVCPDCVDICDRCGNAFCSNHNETTTCETCKAYICSDCSSVCDICGTITCSNCLGSCQSCGTYACEKCLITCKHCENEYCRECMVDGNKHCKECDEDIVSEEDEVGNYATQYASTGYYSGT